MRYDVQSGYLTLPAGSRLILHKWRSKGNRMMAEYVDKDGARHIVSKDTGHSLYDAILIGEPVMGENFVQWKGTNVCMDIVCPKCGQQGHIDADFAYTTTCAKCGATWLMGQSVTMTELAPGTWKGCDPVRFGDDEED